ncbi:V-set and immunoglobulin domain-containing protein 10-like isoform X1 [Periophthalmus magnuspinnatus]|uniref:V-set and immunoglobulin domain-containing protein 10-like isoform X1 n=1 Tax=Periophthalmus magnuspinnatus TaxID=409849 RepID=UPI0024368337|nr:V-set and immunoglobulin domain-containing protein 10-like isoform X1 [Periophthalmus magnuspinnatus]
MSLKTDGLYGVLVCVLLTLLPQGSFCQLELTAAGPIQNSALVGDTVILAVSYSGATNPAIIWRKGPDPVVTWTINSNTPPDIPPSMSNVLRVNTNGSLMFVNLTLDYTSSYSLEMTKSGLGTATLNFTLTVYEMFENVTLSSQPDLAVEGSDHFTLQYVMARGVVQEATWLFKGTNIQSNSHYSVGPRSLVIQTPNRMDTGLYTLTLRNPYSSVTVHRTVTVLYGPDDPVLTLTPAKQFYVSGTSLRLSCKAVGLPPPTVKWMFAAVILNDTKEGVLNLTDVQTSQDGDYTCTVVNAQTNAMRQKNVTVKVYEKPKGSPVCSVRSLADVELQYECAWPGGTPEAVVSFPGLNNSSSAPGHLILNMSAADSLSGTPVSCTASHPVQPGMCNITASPPVPFLPSLEFGVNSEGKIRVTISCLSAAVPTSVVSWLRGTEAVNTGSVHSISPTQLTIQDYNISTFLLHNYTCFCRNPLGVQQRQIQLLAPTISDSSLLTNQEGTVVTLTWEVPPTSVVTGFDIQMQGPDLMPSNQNVGRSNSFRTIQQKPGSARSTDILTLDPEKRYKFRIIPKARLTEGEPSTVLRIGPAEGLSGSAIAGIAAGIPAGIILLLILIGLIYLLIYRNDDSEQARYPVTTDKGVKTKAELASNNIRMAAGLNNYNPDYNRLRKAPSEHSGSLPMFVPPPPVRVATTV